VKRKTTPGQPNLGNPLSKDKVSFKALLLTKPIAVISYLKGFLMESFTLEPTPKIDFTRTVEHTPATARELADLQISLNTLFKHYEILY